MTDMETKARMVVELEQEYSSILDKYWDYYQLEEFCEYHDKVMKKLCREYFGEDYGDIAWDCLVDTVYEDSELEYVIKRVVEDKEGVIKAYNEREERIRKQNEEYESIVFDY